MSFWFFRLKNRLCLPPDHSYGMLSKKDADCVADHIQEYPKNSKCPHYETTYHTFLDDGKKPFIPNLPKIENPIVCDKTNVATLVAPTLCVRNGLWQKDYLVGRSKNEICQIFKNIEWHLPANEEFDRIWDKCTAQDGTGDLVCVETFLKYLTETD